ncbi:hypothetical protein MXB_725 [Myxobolus squamalis]|nr:hypothetical protein MXB_725 [Myxobolus squamalis]
MVVHQPVADDVRQYIKRLISAQALDLSKYPDEIYHLLLGDVMEKFQSRVIMIPIKREA